MKYLQSEKELIYRFNDLFGQTVLFNVLLTKVIITYDESANKLVITYLMIKTWIRMFYYDNDILFILFQLRLNCVDSITK